MATLVGKGRDGESVVLKIDAKGASSDGVTFYVGNDRVWLCDKIPANYITILSNRD